LNSSIAQADGPQPEIPADHDTEAPPIAKVLKHPIETRFASVQLALAAGTYRQRETGIEVIRTELQGRLKFRGSLFRSAQRQIGHCRACYARWDFLWIEGDGFAQG